MSQTETASAALSPMQVYFVKNVGTSAFRDSIGGKKVVIPPGQQVAVPYEAIDCWFGNPSAINDPLKNIKNRQDEFERLRVRYGAYDNSTLWEENKPLVEVTDVDGNVVNTVLADPEGLTVTPDNSSIAEAELLKTTIENMQRQMVSLQSQLEIRNREDQGAEDAAISEEIGDVTEDSPAAIKTGFYK